MKFSRNKKTSIIASVIILTISAMLIALPVVTAHDPAWNIVTYTFVAVNADPIGVGQQTVIVYWVDKIMPTAVGAYGDRWQLSVEITKPDNSKQTMGPYTSDPVGGGWTIFTPDQVGTYTIVAKFPGQTLTGEPPHPTSPRGTEYIGDYYLPSTSDPITLTVQSDPVESWIEPAIPTGYWERPINAMNREWNRIAANWLAGAAQTNGPTTDFQWGTGPETAHILWTTPMWSGGVMDARFGPIGFQTSHYHGMSFTPPIVIDGKVFYNVRSYPREGWRVLDLYTGEELWFHNTTGPVSDMSSSGGFDDPGSIPGESLSFGQIYDYESPNQHGGFPYLWSTTHPTESNTWMMFDAYTGSYICSIGNVSSSGTAVYGKEGSILRYRINNGRLTCWNTSRAIWYEPVWSSNEFWMWRPDLNYTFDGNNGFSLDVQIADVSGPIRAIREGEFIIGGTEGRNNDEELTLGNLWCLSLKPGQEGTLLWNRTFTPPYGVPAMALEDVQYSSRDVEMNIVDPEDGVFFMNQEMTREWWCYSLDTMQLLWGPTEPEIQMSFYGMSSKIYEGKLLSYCNYAGEMTAYDITDGKILWKYNAKNVGFESPYGDYPMSPQVICDGKIYLHTSEHSDTHPLYRGPNLRCIDANTGDEIWKMKFFDSDAVMADGYLLALNSLDMQIYCIGIGPSKTTVTASPGIIAEGSSVMIQGTVTDQSPGTKKTAVMAKSSNAEGIPCIADEYMSEWMEYLYQQQECPAMAEGVEVTLDAIDPNGNFISIGTVKSDMSGMFKKMWTPDIEGEYTIMATFAGSKSYGSSYAETAIGVGPAPTPATPIEPEPTEPEPLITTEIAIIAAVVIVAIIGIVAFLALRRRK